MSDKKITLISCYQSPNKTLCPEDLNSLFKLGPHMIIMGDFNAQHSHWKCPKTNMHGKVLFNHMLSNDYLIHAPPTPTLVHYNNEFIPTTPDLALSINIDSISNMRTIPSLSSNHLPVHFCLYGSLPRKSHTSYRYGEANWKEFRSYLDTNITLSSQTFKSPSEIDEAIQLLTNVLTVAREKTVPKGTTNYKTITLPHTIRKQIKIKNRLRRLEQSEPNPINRRHFRSKINSIQENVNMSIKIHNDRIWNSKLAKVDHPSSDLWRLAKSLRSKVTSIPPLKRDTNSDSLTKTTDEQCEVLAKAFHNNMCLTKDWQSGVTESSVSSSVRKIHDYLPTSPSCPTRPNEIAKHLRYLKRRKAPGPDNLHNILLKNISRKTVVYLVKIFNGCLMLAYFPNPWKVAKVIPVLKNGKDDSIGSSYRPISLLSSLSKLFESLIYKRLQTATTHLIRNEQFGFRKHHSTTQQLARVADHVSHHLNLNQSTGMFLLDLEKAFDTVWHHGLLHKLVLYETPLPLVKLIHSYLENRQFFVSIGDVHSGYQIIPAGVPQGSILGPYLFLMFINDIPVQTRTKLACFADDTASLTSSSDIDLVISRLQLSLIGLHDYFTKWKLKLNETKTEAIMFTRARKPPDRQLLICGHPIEWRRSVKYLGVHLDTKLNWSKHTEITRSKGIKAMGALSPIFNRKSCLSPATKLSIYCTLIRPCLTYACPVWSGTCKTNYTRLQVVQNKAVKISFNTPFCTNLTKLHNRIKLPTLSDFILKQTKRFYIHKTPSHENELVSLIAQTRYHNLNYIDRYNRYRLPHHLILSEL